MNQELRGKIQTFTDLLAWREAHKLVLLVYEATKLWPKEEMFGLTAQIRRAAVSISSNLAEGFSRATFKDKAHFYSMALGSTTEVQNQFLIAKDLKYFASENYSSSNEQTVTVHKLVNGLIKSTKSFAP